jgi:ATP-dependent Lhr-like helicase
MHALREFGDATRLWFEHSFRAASAIQVAGWPPLIAGDHALLLAPTGSGKTLAAFMAGVDRLLHKPAQQPGTRLLYISPIKALAYDIEKNLQIPLREIGKHSEVELPTLRVDVRTGDTSTSERRRQLRSPGEILVTTPESLYLLLGSKARQGLQHVETVIIDEIHSVAANKRGAHLMLSLERLDRLCGRDVQRVGLSATQRPLERVANFLGGDRDVTIVDCATRPELKLTITLPVADTQAPAPAPTSPESDSTAPEKKGMWPLILPRLLALVESHKSTLLFCNSRRLAERIAQELNALAGEEISRAHHGSVARHQRQKIEQQLKAGHLRALVATSSLELGIDMSAIDLVVQIESPGSVARGLQRVGRAGHSLGERSHGVIVPKFRADLLEATVIGKCMLDGEVEESLIPRNCLDVLAQQVVAMCSMEDFAVQDLLQLVRRSYTFSTLSGDLFASVLDMLSGNYPGDDLQDLRARVIWDRQTDQLQARRGSKMISLINGGTIPDRGLFAVHLGSGGPRIGELDEEMVYEARAGEAFFLGASTWRILEITRDQVIVAPAPGQSGKMPFWRGEGPGRPVALGRAIGEFCRAFSTGEPSEQARRLENDYKLDSDAATNLLAYLEEQRRATAHIPSDQCLVIERFCDEVGDWRLCMLSPFGSRVHAPWALAISALMNQRGLPNPQLLWTDDGIALHLPDTGSAPDTSLLLPRADEVTELVVEELASSALFATHFRENAARALLLPRQRPGRRTPLWLQRLRSQQLLTVAKKYASFPIVIETYRECLQDIFDMPALVALLRSVSSGDVQVHSLETASPSPFARSLVFSYVAAFLYEGDAPDAERKAQALTLDRSLLRDLLGTENLREFLDARAIASVEEELQCLTKDRRARDAAELHDMLRRLGALDRDALRLRCESDYEPWLAQLEASGRACTVSLAERPHFIACEDAARYRDAFDLELPSTVPDVFLTSQPDALEELVLRYAAKNAPFRAEPLAAQFGLSIPEALQILEELHHRGRLEHGPMTPGREGKEWCHPEVLRRIRRRSLELLRGQIAPVSASRYACFLSAHHGLSKPGRGKAALREAIGKLAGLALPWSDLESRILPDRVSDYHPEMLDALCAEGDVLWVGAGAGAKASRGRSDRKIRLVLRQHARGLLSVPEPLPPDAPALATRVDEELRSKGASFLVGLDLDGPQQGAEALTDALSYLIWHGRITNDTLGFLRGLKSRPRSARAKIRKELQLRAGRWSSTEAILGDDDATRVSHTRGRALLDCFGVVSRQLGPLIGGGYGDIAKIFRAMEEQGKLRRGHFVSDLEGTQYAYGSTITQLRGDLGEGGQLLAACDPANPYGAALAWPRGIGSRRAGACLLTWQGEPVCFLESGRSKLYTYRRDELLDKVIAELMPALASKTTWRITHIDGESASSSELAHRFEAHEFRREQKALVLERYR